MDLQDLFVNRRYLRFLSDKYPIYVNHNGVLKKCLSQFIKFRSFDGEDYWYRLSDIPERYVERVLDFAISIEDMRQLKNRTIDNIIDNEEVKIYLTDSTMLLPIVGNLLPSDGMNAYTVIRKNGKLSLKPILVCWGCHWSDLFTGQTKYGENVFCLGSDLGKELMERFADDMIPLREVPNFLGKEILEGTSKKI